MRPDRGTLLIVAAGLLLMAPALILGTPPNHGIHYNVTWALDFGEQLRAGQFYPRWLPGSFGGLGTPVFWFYAPLPFFAIGVVDLLAGGALAPEWTIAIAMTALRVVAGIGMRSWLTRLASPRAALVGAVLYMAAPYHLADFYMRGSLGEVAMFAVLPFLAIATAGLGRPGTRSVAGFAVASALLMLCHLTVAFAVGLLLVLPHLSRVAWITGQGGAESWRVLARGMAGGLLGLALAAIYVLPAVLLLDAINVGQMFVGFYAATNWLLAFPERWPLKELLMLVVPVTALAVIVAASVLVLARGSASGAARFWAWYLLCLVLLLCGVPDWPWQPWSPLSRLQFPFRLLVALEFAAATCCVAGFCFLSPRARAWAGLLAVLAALPAWLVVGSFVSYITAPEFARTWEKRREMIVDLRIGVIDHLPAGHIISRGEPSPTPVEAMRDRLLVLAGRGEAWSDTAHVEVTNADRATGAMDLFVQAPAEALVVLHRFYYPLWQLERADGSSGPPLFAHGADRLMAFRAPAGTTMFRLAPATPAVATVSGMVSLVAVAIVTMLAWRRPARRR